MSQLTLYIMNTCPYCQKVVRFMQQAKISVPIKDTLADSKYRQELLSIGGQTQVPCLVIDGKPLYESDDIIKWLKENWAKVQS